MKNSEENNKLNFELKLLSSMVLSVLFFVSLVIGAVAFGQTNALLNEKMAENEEATRPAELELTIIQDLKCEDCFDLQILVEDIQKQNVKIVAEEAVDVLSEKGQELVEKFNIKQVPTLIISGELDKELSLKNIWPTIGEVMDKTFVLRQIGTPYVELDSGEVHGRVSLTILTDTSCTECYDPTVHKGILQRYGWPTNSQEVIDRQDAAGQALIQKYNIELMPTIILEGDIDAYQALKQLWPIVGTIEADGAYVFREGVKQMGAYKNLNTGQVIGSAQPNAK